MTDAPAVPSRTAPTPADPAPADPAPAEPAVSMREVMLFGGVALLAIGAGLWYVPAGFVAAGAVLLLLGVFGVPSWGS